MTFCGVGTGDHVVAKSQLKLIENVNDRVVEGSFRFVFALGASPKKKANVLQIRRRQASHLRVRSAQVPPHINV